MFLQNIRWVNSIILLASEVAIVLYCTALFYVLASQLVTTSNGYGTYHFFETTINYYQNSRSNIFAKNLNRFTQQP